MVNGFLPLPYNTACHSSNGGKKMYLWTPGIEKFIKAPNFFLINNWYFKAINMGVGHSGTVHLSSNDW